MWSGQSTPALLAMLMCTPVVMFVMFAFRPAKGAAIAIVGSALLLPERAYFDIGPIPDLNKYSLPYLVVFVACCMRCPNRVLGPPRERWVIVIALSVIAGSFATVATNPEAVLLANAEVLPGLTAREGIAQALRTLLDTVLPVLLGAALFTSIKDGEQLFSVIAGASVLYSALILVEARMSPQMHNWIYNYSPIVAWEQTYRWGGHRPNVFLAHGLGLAVFVFTSLGCAIALARRGKRVLNLPGGFASVYLAVMLVMCRCTGALVYGGVCVPLWTRTKPATMLRIATVLGVIILAYPQLRLDHFPPDGLMEWLEASAPDRHESLAFRFDAEDHVLKHVEPKWWFGWGSFGRNYSPNDPFGILDGYWIIMLGIGGWTGFLNAFLPLVFPVVLAGRRMRRFKSLADRRFIGIFGLLVIVTSIDLLPNGLFTNLGYLLAGALAGVSSGYRVSNRDADGGRSNLDPRVLLALLPEFSTPPRVSQTGPARRGRTLLWRRPPS